MTPQYKYECRPCPPDTRRQCLEQAHISPGIKRIIGRAFESHTDTGATWDFLQPNCLLVQRDEMIASPPEAKGRGLLSRMRERQKAAEEKERGPPPVVAPPPTVEPDRETVSRPPRFEPPVIEPPVRRRPERSIPPPVIEPPVRRETDRPSLRSESIRSQYQGREAEYITKPKDRGVLGAERTSLIDRTTPSPVTPIQYPEVSRPQAPLLQVSGSQILVAQVSGHRILLPDDGELILGRFDPLARGTPDVDLTFEDQWDVGISRRHAQVTGWRGQYEIADLGSHNGTWINGERLPVQSKHTLQIGDEVRLGSCVLFVDQAPELWNMPSSLGKYFLYVTFTGRYFLLPPKKTIIIGRADPSLDFTPDIDLSYEGDAASPVSRHHAKLTRNQDRFLIEDLGSANKTRVDGQPVHIGMQMPVKPGQHIWLGGCTLALDVVQVPNAAN